MSSSRGPGGWCRGTLMKACKWIGPGLAGSDSCRYSFWPWSPWGWPKMGLWGWPKVRFQQFFCKFHQVIPRYPSYPMTWSIPKLGEVTEIHGLYHPSSGLQTAERSQANCRLTVRKAQWQVVASCHSLKRFELCQKRTSLRMSPTEFCSRISSGNLT